MDHNELRNRQQLQAKTLKNRLQDLDFDIFPAATTHIIGLMVGDPTHCK